jgi:hypothetical protein
MNEYMFPTTVFSQEMATLVAVMVSVGLLGWAAQGDVGGGAAEKPAGVGVGGGGKTTKKTKK